MRCAHRDEVLGDLWDDKVEEWLKLFCCVGSHFFRERDGRRKMPEAKLHADLSVLIEDELWP